MQQLLKITNVPIEYEWKVERPRLEVKRSSESMAKQPRLDIKSKNIKVNIDTHEMRKSMGKLSVFDATRDAFERGKEAAKDATAQYAEIGNQMAKIHQGANIPDIMYSKLFKNVNATTKMIFLPDRGPNLSWEPNELHTEYVPAESNDIEAMRNVLEYIPGGFTVHIKQYPKVIIEYLGTPMYVPPSASPDYKEE